MSHPAFDIQIDKVVFGGLGLCRIGGKVCFVEDVLPGEKVRVRVMEQRKNFSKGKLTHVLEPSLHRVQARCAHFGVCGGCQYQMVSYEEELRIKQEQVIDTLTRSSGLDKAVIREIQASPSDYGYRNHVTVHRREEGDGWEFYVRDHRKVIKLESCPIAAPHLERALLSFSVKKSDSDRMTLWIDEQGMLHTSAEEAPLKLQLDGKSWETSTRGFFQNNLGAAEALIKILRQWIQNFKPSLVADSYAGSGVLGLTAGAGVDNRIFIESNPKNMAALRNNQLASSQAGAVWEGDAEDLLPRLISEWGDKKMFLILDPPREGLSPRILKSLQNWAATRSAQHQPARVAYVSCDLAVLGRDLKALMQSNWKVIEAAPVDMFPRTRHIETAVLLEPTIPG